MALTTKTLADLAGHTESWASAKVRGLPSRLLPTKGRPRRVYQIEDVCARLEAATVDYSVLIAKLRALVPEGV